MASSKADSITNPDAIFHALEKMYDVWLENRLSADNPADSNLENLPQSFHISFALLFLSQIPIHTLLMYMHIHPAPLLRLYETIAQEHIC